MQTHTGLGATKRYELLRKLQPHNAHATSVWRKKATWIERAAWLVLINSNWRPKAMTRTGLFTLVLVVSGACAQARSQNESPSSVDEHTSRGTTATDVRNDVLQPYLGKWRPTSFREQQNIASLSISADSLVLETGPSLTFEVVRSEGAAVILRVTGHAPPDYFSTTGALAMLLETQALRNPKPNEKQTREVLRIHWCNRLDQLSDGLAKSTCSINGYVR